MAMTIEEYNTVQLNNAVLDVKDSHTSTKYKSKEKYMESIDATQITVTEEKKSKRNIINDIVMELISKTPTNASTSDIPMDIPTDVIVSPKSTIKVSNKTKVKPLKLDIPPKRSAMMSTRWARHVYEMMIEAAIPITDEIIHAFNNLIKCLKKYSYISTSSPQKSERYTRGIQLIQLDNRIEAIHLHFDYNITYEVRQSVCIDIMDTYFDLFNLIKDIIPFMKKKHEHVTTVNALNTSKATMIHLHKVCELMIKEREREIKQHENAMKQHEYAMNHQQHKIVSQRTEIQKLEETIAKYSE